MPTLLRIALVLLATGVLYAGIAVLALAEVVGAPDAGRLGAGSVAAAALALPPMLGGVFASYWSWDASARRRLRVLGAVLLLVQVAAAVTVIAVAGPSFPVASVALVVVAAALDPTCVALGRAARRIELRRPAPADDLDGFRDRIRVGWRRGGIGAVVGLAVGVLIDVALLVPLAGRGDSARALLFLPAGAGIGASIGMLTIVLGLTRCVRDLLGGDYASARRIGRAVSGKPEALSPDEAARAARYAAVAPAWLGLRTTQTVVNSLAVAAVLGSSLLGPSQDLPGAGALFAGVLVVLLAAALTALVVGRLQVRRFRRYADAHPA